MRILLALMLFGMAFMPFYETSFFRVVPVHSFCRFVAGAVVYTERNPDWRQLHAPAQSLLKICHENIGFEEHSVSSIGSAATHLWNYMKINFNNDKYTFPIMFEYAAWASVVVSLLIPSTTGFQMFPLIMLMGSILMFGKPVESLSDLLWPFWTAFGLSAVLFLTNRSVDRQNQREIRRLTQQIQQITRQLQQQEDLRQSSELEE